MRNFAALPPRYDLDFAHRILWGILRCFPVDGGGCPYMNLVLSREAGLAANQDQASQKVNTQLRDRLAYIDNIRWTMIILVLSMHASDTYSPFGNWYFTDRGEAGTGTILTFGIYQSFLQAFFMALLFFISGYFAAPSLDRKGGARFAKDRFIRLGLPTLLYMLVIGPLTQYFLSHTWGTGGFVYQWFVHLFDGEWLSNSGPMWFCAALLIFSLAYAWLPPGVHANRASEPRLPGNAAIITFILLMAGTTFLTRIVLPEGRSILNMHPGDFPQYILMFAAGVAAYRGQWLNQVPVRFARRWCIVALGSSMPLLAALLIMRYVLHSNVDSEGGFSVASAIRPLWEAFVCVGMSFGLIALYRAFFDRQGRAARFLSDNAFAVYLFHPPVLIALAVALRSLTAPPLVKAAILTVAAAIATYAVSAVVFRRIPLLRRIL
jgi:glucans biosynthesis protein C